MPQAGYYLDNFLAPLAPWLSRDDITDIWINREGELWFETTGGVIAHERVAALDEATLGRLARQLAAHSSQGIGRAQPLLAATLPDGSRVQVVAPPATRGGHIVAIRKHVAPELSLAQWSEDGAFEGLAAGEARLDHVITDRLVGPDEAPHVLREAVRGRRNILVAGGTSSGKTTFLNALLAEIPPHERLVLIEDTEELRLRHENAIGLIAARGQESEAQVSAEDLLIAALRLRPDRIILGELRGSEAFTFLRAVNTGHPGSMTTIHADTPARAIEQLVLLVLQAGSRLGRDDVRHYVRESVDVFVQLAREGGKRKVSQVMVVERV
ncbi:P-type DNA transfer ATPase VirB11 [Erythrobacter arachoides]|uniref:P-type DNA transfer ATPase VirB11 n=1 Tax=Aurantiacibacter arachoides TaxID=1850444 RepID=A0A845A1P7_9SPHN|nr:P-type DNA transfer ATPase VirB11 [Aurantiacibacter arachoides]MXO92877.1 P-type DNA transfer ATPase VirB11 [Aurantiacibacter arachoides]GGD53777.1 P-type DNA transfer ATPase VirB11 [Aurantiacibacter arachoides]